MNKASKTTCKIVAAPVVAVAAVGAAAIGTVAVTAVAIVGGASSILAAPVLSIKRMWTL